MGVLGCLHLNGSTYTSAPFTLMSPGRHGAPGVTVVYSHTTAFSLFYMTMNTDRKITGNMKNESLQENCCNVADFQVEIKSIINNL